MPDHLTPAERRVLKALSDAARPMQAALLSHYFLRDLSSSEIAFICRALRKRGLIAATKEGIYAIELYNYSITDAGRQCLTT